MVSLFGLDLFRLDIRDDQLLIDHLVVNELSFAHVTLLAAIRHPDFIPKLASRLALGMFVITVRIDARVELAHGLIVCEFASFHLAVGAVFTHRHCSCGVTEWTIRIGAVGEELAFLLRLVAELLGRRGMSADTLAIFACSPKRTFVANIDRGSRWCFGRGVSKRTILLRTF